MISTLELAKTSSFEAEKVGLLLQKCLAERVQVSLKVGSRRYKAEVLDLQKGVFEIHNNLDRDSVMGELRGRNLVLCLPCDGFLFEGTTSLMGLGFVKPFPTLKLAVPAAVHKVEKRHSYRLTHFAAETEVLYSTPDYQIGKGSLLDISMSGCGIRTDGRSTIDLAALKKDPRVFLDIKIGPDILLRVDAAVVYIGQGKLGCHFLKLPEGSKQALYRYIVQARKDLMFKRMQEEKTQLSSPQSPAESTNKPQCLVVFSNDEWLEFLTNVLHRKYEVISCGFRVQDVREHLAKHPVVTLMEVQYEDSEQVRSAKKLGSIVLGESLLLYFGENFNSAFYEYFAGHGDSLDILIDLVARKKLEIFRKIDGYVAKHIQT